ncbi:MAG: hypothetical protein LC105_03320 [Chitinophagales bacterium]|nr:hypothetical protein [Chitinophagales bacterium]
MNKPIILTNFGYQRSNWIAPIEAIRDEFEVIYIHFNSKKDEYANYTDSKVLYYSDFKNAQQLIDKIKPSIFIAMGLYGNQIYAIKEVCNQRNIPFTYMDHGLYGLERDYNEGEKKAIKFAANSTVENIGSRRSSNHTFVINTFLSSYSFFKLITVLVKNLMNKISFIRLKHKNLFQKYLAEPNAFITYSVMNNTVNQQIYRPKEQNVHYIGNFEYDKFRTSPDQSKESYLLFIDSPLSDNPHNYYFFTTDLHRELYKKVSYIAKNKGLKLKLKLHPYNYHSNWLEDIDNVEYVKDCDLNSLIQNAKYCIGFYSTILIPAIYFVPTIIIKTQDHSFIDFIEKENLCNVYDVSELMNLNNITFKPLKANENSNFKEKYFNVAKQSSVTRLKKAIYAIIA